MSMARGQFTIVDLNDATTLTGYIGSNLAKTQMYNRTMIRIRLTGRKLIWF